VGGEEKEEEEEEETANTDYTDYGITQMTDKQGTMPGDRRMREWCCEEEEEEEEEEETANTDYTDYGITQMTDKQGTIPGVGRPRCAAENKKMMMKMVMEKSAGTLPCLLPFCV